MVTIFINSMVNLVFNLTNLTYVFKLLVVMFPMPMIMIKLITFLIYTVVIVLVIEPEKLRWMTTITMTTFMTISKKTFPHSIQAALSGSNLLVWFFFYDSVALAMSKEKPPITLTAFDWGNAGNFLGVCTYAYESIGSIFNGTISVTLLNHSEENDEGQDQNA